jgi:hypothetical protein
MPGGKPAGVRCPQLSGENRCLLYGKPERPAVCAGLKPSRQMCGSSREEAMLYLWNLEELTKPPLRRAFVGLNVR